MLKSLSSLVALSMVSLAQPALASASQAPKLFVYDHDARGTGGLEAVKRKLENGFSVAIHGESLDMVELYPFLKELKVPVSLTAEESQRLDERHGHLFDAEDQRKAGTAESPSAADAEPASRVTALILLHPSHGRVFADVHEFATVGTDTTWLKNQLRSFRTPDNIARQMEGFANDLGQKVLPRASDYANLQSGQLMTSIRKSETFYGNFYFAGVTYNNRPAGKHITDYLIYNAQDTDPSYDHLIVQAVAEVYTFPSLNNGSPPYVTRAFQGWLDNYYGSDMLIDQDPDTTMTLRNDGTQYGFIIGFPATVQFSYGWSGNSDTTMVGVGNKTSQTYYNQFTRQANVGLSYNPFTVKYSAMYKSAGTLLRLYYKNLFGVALDGTPSGYTWYGNTQYILHFDY